MSFKIDSSRALRTHDQLTSLVRAVLAASAEDESRSVEWKSSYDDLTSNEASFAIARAILGLANRPVAVAATAFEGVGYVVVGAEPSSLVGQSVPDSAELLNAVRRYAGNGRPFWDPRSITVDRKNVLVITVEPPNDGDRIALLQKAFQPAKGKLVEEGTIFVRQPGATERASRTDVEMLQDRLVAGALTDDGSLAAAHNGEVRSLVADAVGAAHRWADTMQTLVVMTAAPAWRQKDMMEFINTDSGRQLGTDMAQIKDSARRLRLLSADPELLAPLKKASEALANSSAFDGIHGSGPSSLDDRSIAYTHLKNVKRSWEQVEVAAAGALAT